VLPEELPPLEEPLLDDLPPDELPLELLEPDELLELEPLELELLLDEVAATVTVAEVGEPKVAPPETDVSLTPKPFPAAPRVSGTLIARGDVSPAAHVIVPAAAE